MGQTKTSSAERDGLFALYLSFRERMWAIGMEIAEAATRAHDIGYDGRRPEIIDQPGPGENPQMRVARNIREHPLDLMFHKGQITPDQFNAGERYRHDLEFSLISPMSGRDYENIYTDRLAKAEARERGGAAYLGADLPKRIKVQRTWNDVRPITLDAMARAQKARAAVVEREGDDVAAIVEAFLRECRTVQEVAALRDAAGGVRFGNRNTVGRKLQRGLDALARHYGIGQRGPSRSGWVQPFYADEPVESEAPKGERV